MSSTKIEDLPEDEKPEEPNPEGEQAEEKELSDEELAGAAGGLGPAQMTQKSIARSPALVNPAGATAKLTPGGAGGVQALPGSPGGAQLPSGGAGVADLPTGRQGGVFGSRM